MREKGVKGIQMSALGTSRLPSTELGNSFEGMSLGKLGWRGGFYFGSS